MTREAVVCYLFQSLEVPAFAQIWLIGASIKSQLFELSQLANRLDELLREEKVAVLDVQKLHRFEAIKIIGQRTLELECDKVLNVLKSKVLQMRVVGGQPVQQIVEDVGIT